MKILITGSAGYIGSCLYEFLKKNFNVYGIDRKKPKIKLQKNFFKCDLLNYQKLNKIFESLKPDLIIHLAGQSTIDFIGYKNYYLRDNYYATQNLMKLVKKNSIKYFIFSSTAAVYKPSKNNLDENSIIKPNNVYGKTKLMCENLISSILNRSYSNYIIFRFFNVCSSFAKEKIGEFHNPETHLIPIMASKFLSNDKVFIYGRNFNTKDKTCVRDYVHINDILKAFFLGIKYLVKFNKSEIINLGTKVGYSNLEIFNKYKNFYNYQYNEPFFVKKRKGDVDKLVCDNKKAFKLLKWKPKFSQISRIIKDEKNWQNFLIKKKRFRTIIY
jgi:UDP-glucose 4-epimerase